jgi:hypothetical protein
VVASHTHNLKELINVANLEVARREQARNDPVFSDNWDFVKQWSEQSRYRRHSRDTAEALVEAVGNGKHGVIAWIKRHW